eukprot:2725048-Pleurochrysis_carterae.AAC.1
MVALVTKREAKRRLDDGDGGGGGGDDGDGAGRSEGACGDREDRDESSGPSYGESVSRVAYVSEVEVEIAKQAAAAAKSAAVAVVLPSWED